MNDYATAVKEHYSSVWGRSPRSERRLRRGRIHELPDAFTVLEFAPTGTRSARTYATCAMSQPGDEERLELHMFGPSAGKTGASLVELLTITAHYHRTGARLGLGHSVKFGRPWLPTSACDHGLISLPYLDGPRLEWVRIAGAATRFLWLIPITSAEVELKRREGLDALEERFEAAQFDYLDPARPSVA